MIEQTTMFEQNDSTVTMLSDSNGVLIVTLNQHLTASQLTALNRALTLEVKAVKSIAVDHITEHSENTVVLITFKAWAATWYDLHRQYVFDTATAFMNNIPADVPEMVNLSLF